MPGALNKTPGCTRCWYDLFDWLALGELRCATRRLQAVLFAFLHARVTRQQARFFENAAKFWIDLQERAGDTVTDCAGRRPVVPPPYTFAITL